MSSLIDRLLIHYPAHLHPSGPVTLLENAGGESGASLWRYQSTLGPVVARRWPLDGPTPRVLAYIHDWLEQLRSLAYVPVPFRTTDGLTAVALDGQLWELQPWKAGIADLSRPPADIHLVHGFGALASIHQRLGTSSRESRSTSLQDRLEEVESLLPFELHLMRAAVNARKNDELTPLAERWLLIARAGLEAIAKKLNGFAHVRVKVQPVLRDARPDHFLFEGPNLTGIVDYGAMAIDTPAIDLARLLVEWIGENCEAKAKAIKAYESVRALVAGERELIDIAAESALWLGPARWIRWHFVAPGTFANPNSCSRGLKRTMAHLEEHLRSSGLVLPRS